jgi:ring-1,2-phenylacetyl-CoA epoxidase subunit PaaC
MASPTSDSYDVLTIADACLVWSHRLTEWISNAPSMEEDVAIGNIALDLLGQARGLYAVLDQQGLGSEDQLAYFRHADGWRNPVICELDNGDFGHTMLRLLLVSEWLRDVWTAWSEEPDERVRGVAEKAIKENAYHLRHARSWVTRLEDGTVESQARMAAAHEALDPYAADLRAAQPMPHTPALTTLLAEMQSLARAHPGASW